MAQCLLFQALDNQESLLREIDDAFSEKYTGLDIYNNQFSIANARTFTITVTWISLGRLAKCGGKDTKMGSVDMPRDWRWRWRCTSYEGVYTAVTSLPYAEYEHRMKPPGLEPVLAWHSQHF